MTKIVKITTIIFAMLIIGLFYYSFLVGLSCNYKSEFSRNDVIKILTCKQGVVTEITYKLDDAKNLVFSGLKSGRQFRIANYLLLYQNHVEIINSSDHDLLLEFINNGQYNMHFFKFKLSNNYIFLYKNSFDKKQTLTIAGHFHGSI